MIEFTLPTPPSWNRLYAFGMKRMYKTREYTNWMQRAVAWGMAQNVPPAEGFVSVEYVVPQNRRMDMDNRLKALGDSLETIGILANDRQIRKITISEETRDDVLVKIAALEPGGSGDGNGLQ